LIDLIRIYYLLDFYLIFFMILTFKLSFPFILPFPVLWFATTVLTLGILGVWWVIFAIVWIAAIIAMIYVRNIVNKVCVGC